MIPMTQDKSSAPTALMVHRQVRVWDLPTRLFHWSIVVLVAASYVTSRLNWMVWHVWIGEMQLVLLLFRLLWGCFGSETARFRNFLANPLDAIRHLRHLFRREPDLQVGHNPAGGWVVLVLLTLLLVATLSGLYVNNDLAHVGRLTGLLPGPIADLVPVLHATLFELLLATVALHVLIIIAYARIKGHDLLQPMLTGYKWLPLSVRPPRCASTAPAIFCLLVAVAAVMTLATYL
jgi:cytochrome b